MTDYIITPDLGDGIGSAKIITVFVKAGQTIGIDETLVEVESDKATLEIPSDKSGTIGKLLVNVGDEIKVGDKLCELTAGKTDIAGAPPEKQNTAAPQKPEPAKPAKKSAPAGGSQVIKLSNLGEGMEQISVLKLLIKNGDTLTDPETPILEAESEKATVEIPANTTGKIKSILITEGQQLSIGDPLFEIESDGAATQEEPAAASPPPEKSEPPADVKAPPIPKAEKSVSAPVPAGELYSPLTKGKIVPASPQIRRFAREIGVDLTQVTPTGIGGVISKDDVKQYAKMRLSGAASQNISTGGTMPAAVEPPMPDFSAFGDIETVEMNKIKQVTARHMSMCNNTIPMVTHFDKVNITLTEEARKRFKAAAESNGVKLTMTGVLVKAAVIALKQFPKFNASIDIANNKIIHKKYYHIGIAVDTPNGLLVPVIKHADQKSILEISKDLGEISTKAKARKLGPADMSGATFTISNLGGISSYAFTPIVNWPEVAILGISKSSIEPVYENGSFVPKLMMPISLTYDHRIIDGADGARFAKFLCEVISDPFSFGFY